ncbi:MAG: flavodoxin domain-containing protein [Solirubrobacterales bacterium]
MKVLVAHASKHGSTAEIAEAIAAGLRENGLDADCMPAADVEDVGAYDAVVLGSAVYMKRWQGDARHFLRSHAKELGTIPFWVFSSGPTGDPAEDDAAWQEPKRTIAKAEKLGVRDHVVFGGRISPEAGRMAKAMAENTPEEYRDRRDWDEIRAWAAGIATELGA